jgi:type IV secretory pathway VirB10-like protein
MTQDNSSPKGIFPSKKIKIKGISKRGVIAVGLSTFLLMLIAVLAIFSQNGLSLEKDAKAEGAVQKVRPASQPETLIQGKERAQAEQAQGTVVSRPTASVGGTVVTNDPDIQKEKAEYEREIRRYQHQQYMQKLARMDAAAISPLPGSTAEGPGQGSSQSGSGGALGTEPSRMADGGSGSGGEIIGDSKSDPNLQGRKQNFYAREQDSSYLLSRKQAPISENEIKQGSIIPGILVTGINSDLPGQIIGQVSQNVYDTATGNVLLIPQGTKVVGTYDSVIAIGQDSAMLVWTRLIFPDASSIDLRNMGGTDQGGYAGARDQVDNHYLKIFGSAAMLSLIGAGYQLSQPQVSGNHLSAQEIIQAQVGQQMAQVSGELARRNLAIQPTIKIRPGYRFNVMINKDMILEPWNEGAAQ